MVEPLNRPVTSYMHGQFVSIDKEVSVADAVKIMHNKRAEVIIVNDNKQNIGIVTDSDILDKVVIKGEDSDQVQLKSIMTSPLITISAKSTVRQALEIMRLNEIKHLPITDNTSVVGLVTQEGLADSIRTSVIEKTFRPYRIVVREHYKPIFANLGFIMQFSGILLIAPAILGALFTESQSATGIFLSVFTMFLFGFILNSYGERRPLNLRQASILLISSFVLLSLIGSIPYIYVNPFPINSDFPTLFINGFFESASGFTTTGLSVISQPEDLPKSLNFYRAYTQWVGGLSFVYLVMTLFYPEKKLSHLKGMIGGGIIKFKQLLVTISIIFTIYTAVLSILLIFFGEIQRLDAVSLIFSTVTGGGFLPISTYVSIENVFSLNIIMTGMVISALPFAFHYAIFSKEVSTKGALRLEVLVYLFLIFVFVFIFYFLWAIDNNSYSQTQNLLTSIFHVISASTNSGFQFIDISILPYSSKVILMALMLIGGTAFSTAGGIKVGRILQIFQRILSIKIIKDIGTSRSISSASSRYSKTYDYVYDTKATENKAKRDVKESLIVVILFIIFSFITGIVISIFNNSGFIDSLFESVSALTTTGLSTGITSLNMDAISKTFLIVNMIFGRFEIIAILYLFIGFKKKQIKKN